MNHQLKNIKRFNKAGQNIIEYLLVTTSVVLVLLVIMNTQNSLMKQRLENVLEDTVSDINGLDRELRFSNTSN